MTTIRGWAAMRPDYNCLIRFGHTSTETDELNPLLSSRLARADPVIRQSSLFGLASVIDIAQVDQHLPAKRRRNPLEVERSELIPLGDDHQRVRALGRG